jgi:DNA-directed RNA polymerase subunit RPC12/RpoP
LVIGGGDLHEYRCDSCGRLLMRGINLEKAIVEIKCKACGVLARTH